MIRSKWTDRVHQLEAEPAPIRSGFFKMPNWQFVEIIEPRAIVAHGLWTDRHAAR